MPCSAMDNDTLSLPLPSAHTEAMGTSEAFLSFQEQLSRVAAVDRPVLIIGERGTGKELAAVRLHYLSRRWRKPLVTVNCASLSETLLESELFGHEAGAFTGAAARRAGRFEQADGGTLFLDEIAAMPRRMQESILRTVEYGSLQRVGGSRPVQTDVRIVGATNAHLPQLAAQGIFLHDLLDRLSFEVLTLPPLRERGEDILLLAQRFASSMSMELELDGTPEFGPDALRTLHRHPWPGNIRELKNTVERAVFRQGLRIAELPVNPFHSPWQPHGAPERPSGAARPVTQDNRAHAPLLPPDLSTPLPEAIRRLELHSLQQALLRARHNQRQAADLLGLTYHQFRGLYRRHKQAIEQQSHSGSTD